MAQTYTIAAGPNGRETVLFNNGLVLRNVHPAHECIGKHCVVHRPSDHHMRDWVLYWRDDRKIFERICREHGVGHPDPDQAEYFETQGADEFWDIHGCCGCCAPETDR